MSERDWAEMRSLRAECERLRELIRVDGERMERLERARDTFRAEVERLCETLRELWEFTGRDRHYVATDLAQRINAALNRATQEPPT